MEALLSIALSNAAVATLLALIAAAVARFCRRPAVRHALWLLVLLKLITPPLVPLSVSWPRMEEAEPAAVESPPSAIARPPATEPAEPSVSLSESREPTAAPAADPPATPLTFAEVWMPLVMALWLSGSLCWWTIAAVRLRRFQRLMRQTRPAPEDVQEQARRSAVLLGLRRCPPVAFTSAPLSPMLWALGFSPRLLVPAALWQRLGAEQQDTLLAHELAHLRRGDHWVRRLEFVVLGLYWWHPVVWWARRRLQEAEEECCDAFVVSILPDAASAYASALVETVTFLSQARPAALVGASGAGQVPLLKRRLTMILTETPARKPSRLAFWTVLGLGALLLPLAPGAAKPEMSEPQSPAEPARRQGDMEREILQAHGVQNCITCHAAQSVHAHELLRKPQSWQEAHDEIIRLMDEVRRRQAQLRESAKRPPAAVEPDRSEEIEKLKDEIELLKLKVQLKDARRKGTQQRLKEVLRRHNFMNETNRRTPGAVSSDRMLEVWMTKVGLEADATEQEIEWKEATLLLKQAERRLARLQRPAERSTQPSSQKPAEPSLSPGSNYSHNFGTVKRGTILKHQIPMKNPNNYPIHISGVRSSAGSLTVRAPKLEIPPGGKTTVDIEIDTGRFTGSKTFTVYVEVQEGRWVMPAEFRVVSVDAVPASSASGATGQDKQTQLKELENKIESLQKELRDLRREMRPDKPRDPGSVPDGLKR